MVDRPTSAVGVFDWAFHIVGEQESDCQAVIGIFRRNMLSNNVVHGSSHGQPIEMKRHFSGGVGDPCGHRNHLVSDGARGCFHQCRVTGQCRCGGRG